jgi:hypothetical protein
MKKIEIYTATCNYKFIRNDILCFNGENIFQNPILEAKRYKILSHLFIDSDISIYVDGNIILNIPLESAVEKYLGNNDIAIFKHPHRDCIYNEFDVLYNDGRFKFNNYLQQKLRNQDQFYKLQGYPKHIGLWECNFIIRRNNEKVIKLMNAWWAEICKWQWRDQVSFPYVLWKYGKGIKMNTINEVDIRRNSNFTYYNHY